VYKEDVEEVIELDASYSDIASLAGIEYFTSLTWLSVRGNQLTEIDVSKNIALWSLDVPLNQLTKIDVSKNTALTWLSVSNNQLTAIDVSKNTALQTLHVDDNQLTTIDVSKNTALEVLGISENQITSIDLSKNTALTWLNAWSNQLTTIDVSKNTELTYLKLGNNRLTTIDVSKNTALTWLSVSNNQLTAIDVSKNTALTYLDLDDNQLSSINLLNNTALTTLYANYNRLTSINVSNNTELIELYLYSNQITSINLSNNTKLEWLDIGQNRLTTLNVSGLNYLDELYCDRNYLSGVIGWNGDIEDQHALGFLAATKVNNLPNSATIGVPLTLKGTVFPSDATNKTIIEWGIDWDEGTGAEVNGSVFTAKKSGTVWLYVVVANGSAANEDLEYYFPIHVKEASTPIFANQENPLIKGIMVQTIGNTITLQNLPSNAKVEVYNLQGKLVHNYQPTAVHQRNAKREGSSQLIINVQTKGMYVIKINNQALRVVVK
jgi:Leucine-rich repeat (LRR) protein